MTRTIITETPAGTSNSFALAAGDELIVAPGVILADDTLNAIGGAFGGNIVHILGSVLSGGNGVSLSDFADDDANSRLMIAPGGSVVGEGSGIVTSRDRFEIQIDGAVQGEVGVRHTFGDFYFLVVGATGSVAGFDEGILVSSNDARLTNYGQVSSLSGQNGIQMSGERTALVNHGVVSSPVDAVRHTGNTDANVVNHGQLSGGVTLAGGADVFSNFGMLQGDADMENGDDVLTNAGLIDGDVALGQGADTFDGRGGRVAGDIDGGEGDDVYILDRASDSRRIVDADGVDEVQTEGFFRLRDGIENLTQLDGGDWKGIGNALANSLRGNGGDNKLLGLIGNDTLIGGLGDDMLKGGLGTDLADYRDSFDRIVVSLLDGVAAGSEIGEDRLKGIEQVLGGSANDRIIGSNTANSLGGNFGNDRLDGEGGADVLNGGGGADRLFGGRGADTMTGGFDADRFVIEATANGADAITDFTDGEDRIDLRSLNLVRRQFEDLLDGALSQSGGDAVLSLARLGADGSITLQGVDGATLDRSDFLV
ncbi:MAG: M10 family metallopeptidase C-terminal domain-containing protein [Pseudomonadota bacterium]